jgi:hypothetical protein
MKGREACQVRRWFGLTRSWDDGVSSPEVKRTGLRPKRSGSRTSACLSDSTDGRLLRVCFSAWLNATGQRSNFGGTIRLT